MRPFVEAAAFRRRMSANTLKITGRISLLLVLSGSIEAVRIGKTVLILDTLLLFIRADGIFPIRIRRSIR